MLDSARPLSLKGSLLLADPSLSDRYFRHAVVLLTEHDKTTGAHGYVINKPQGKKVGDVLRGPEFEGLANVPIYVGGPVSQEHLIFAALQWKVATKRLTVQTHLSGPEALERQERGEVIRAFLGYSGWSSGQLEHEMRANSWVTRPPGPGVLEPGADELLWKRLVTSLGPYYELRSYGPKHPGMN
jgi:putative transcriptional regulator